MSSRPSINSLMRWFTAKDEDETFPLREGEAEALVEQAKKGKATPVALKFTMTLRPGEEKVIGRPDFPTTMFSRMLSRRHLAVGISADGLAYVRDVASRNGTFIGGQKIKADVNVSVHPTMSITVAGVQAPFELRMAPHAGTASGEWVCTLTAECFER